MNDSPRHTGHLRRLLHAWTYLAPAEQRALLLVLAIFLFGVAVRYWHLMLR